MEIVALCTLESGLVPIKFAIDRGVKIKKIIGLADAENKNNDSVSGIVDIGSFCSGLGIEFSYIDSYSLMNASPSILGESVDILWVVGWQRLIPQSFIDYARYGAFGAHGSCDGITAGRGRSPQNWALLIGADQFEVSTFKILPGVDDGPVFSTYKFQISSSDTIRSLQVKVGSAVANSIFSLIKNPNFLRNPKPQIGEPRYFPRRMPLDGGIDWNMKSIDIVNQVRALTFPYPGAFTFLKNRKFFVKSAVHVTDKCHYTPGKVIYTYDRSVCLVAALDGVLLIDGYFNDNDETFLKNELLFDSVKFIDREKEIYRRFKNEKPDCKLNQRLLDFWGANGFDTSTE